MEELRRCSGCEQAKPLELFNWRRKEHGQRDNLCRPCRAAYKHEHYSANRQRYIDQSRHRKQALARERTAFLIAYFEEHPCLDCGEGDPVVLEFDHLRDKAFDIGQALPYRSWASILAETDKCEVVCANCHRRRTAKRIGNLRLSLSRQSG